MKFAIVAATIFAGDTFLKIHLEKRLQWGREKEFCKGKILLCRHHNYGAALNFLEKQPNLVKGLCASLLLVLSGVWFFLRHKRENVRMLLGLSFLLGGGGSNLYDRLSRGYVVDYVRFQTPWKRLNRSVFNVSDFFIFLGGILLIFSEKT